MFTFIAFATFYLVFGLADASLFYDLSRWHFPALLGGILSWVLSLVLGLIAVNALQSLTWFDLRLSKEAINDPFGNQVPNLDLIAHSFWIALVLTALVPEFAGLRKARHLPVAGLPHWTGLMILVAIAITVALIAMLPRAVRNEGTPESVATPDDTRS